MQGHVERRRAPRVHLTGASGTGQTTLGRLLAVSLDVPHVDTDDAYWVPTDPPYTIRRPPAERRARVQAMQGDGGWVISGSLMGWGDPLIEGADLTVFLTLDPRVRLARLRARERARFGNRIAPGGDMEQTHRSFLNWVAGYDDPAFGGRSIEAHLSWLSSRPEPVLHLDTSRPVEMLRDAVMVFLTARRGSTRANDPPDAGPGGAPA